MPLPQLGFKTLVMTRESAYCDGKPTLSIMKFISPMHFCLAAVWLSSVMPHALTAAIESKTAPYPTFGSIERLDPAMDALLEPDARMEELATGFYWTEGPVWWPEEGMLLFSDVPQNTVFSWKEGRGIGIYLRPFRLHGWALCRHWSRF